MIRVANLYSEINIYPKSVAFILIALESKPMIVDFTPNPKSLRLARSILAEARENETVITPDIREIVNVLKAEIVGLENKFKSKESLARKLTNYSVIGNIPLEKAASRINDALRYTLLFSPDNYLEDHNSALNLLREKGYQIQRIWNAWSNTGKPNDTGYLGINATIISSKNQKFEIQFHTAETFRLKTETHVLYEERRSPNISKERDAEILQIMKKLSAKIERPKGV